MQQQAQRPSAGWTQLGTRGSERAPSGVHPHGSLCWTQLGVFVGFLQVVQMPQLVTDVIKHREAGKRLRHESS